MDKRRRAQERKELSQPITIQDIINNRPIGELVNISANGLMLICDDEIDTNSIFQFSMHLPKEINGQSRLDIGVDCLWCRKVDNFNRYWAGFQIIDASDETNAVIELLIENYTS